MSADLNQFIQKVPKPLLVIVVLIIAIGLFVYNDPLRDECEVQGSLFTKKMRGLFTTKSMKKVGADDRVVKQFPQIDYWKERCKEGNSIGSCNDYFEGLRSLTTELRLMSEKCQIAYSERNEIFSKFFIDGLQIMALAAWGERPPEGPGERLGWLTQTHLQTFCNLQRTFKAISSEEAVSLLTEKVYREYPDNWPDTLPPEERIGENRPRALKTGSNPDGTMKWKDIHERSLFSIKCDNYM